MTVNPIPDGYNSVTPYLIIKDAAAAIEFYKKALNAKELYRLGGPNGKIGHAEIKIGNCNIMLADENTENPEMKYFSPSTLGSSPVNFVLYVEDVDKAFKQALDAGGKLIQPLELKFYGDKSGSFQDPFGYTWSINTHVEDVPPEEVDRRARELYRG